MEENKKIWIIFYFEYFLFRDEDVIIVKRVKVSFE